MPATYTLASTVGSAVAAGVFFFAVWYIWVVRQRQRELKEKNITLQIPGWLKAITVAGLMVTAGAAGYALSFYNSMVFLDDNLAYMAMYYDDVAVDLYRTGESYDNVLMASVIATQYCTLYQAEKRQLDHSKYDPLCSVVQNRSILLQVCAEDPDGLFCSDEQLDELDRLIVEAEHLGEQLKTYRPYFGHVFRPGYSSQVCYIGNEEVPCPW